MNDQKTQGSEFIFARASSTAPRKCQGAVDAKIEWRRTLDAGYVEGRDVVIEWRSANGDYDRVPALVADLVRSKVEVIVEDSTVGTEATKRATSTIPVVMALVLDPVATGLVKSLAHPGGNVTGLSMTATELYPKRLQLLKEINPQLTRVAVFWNPDHPFHAKAVEESRQSRNRSPSN